MRILTCIRLPDDIKQSLKNDIARLKENAISGKFTDDSELFIPLNDLGETSQTAGAKAIIDRVSIPKFEQGIGGFGCTRKGTGDTYKEAIEMSDGLLDLQRQLQVGFTTAGYKVDTAPYKPFMVLCKDAKMKPGFNPQQFGATIPFVSFEVERVSLVRCDRVDGVYYYSEMCSVELPDDE